MPKLTRSRLAQVAEILDQSLFTSSAFEIVTTEDTNDVLTITYSDEKRFRAKLFYGPRAARSVEDNLLSALHPRERVLWQEFCPGSFIEVEREDCVKFDQFLHEVKGWTDRLRGEIVLVGAFQQQFREFQEGMNAKLEEHFSDAAAHFTKEEKAEVLDRLRDFQQRIEELEKSKQATQAEVEKLSRTVSDLYQAAETLPKKAWYRTACSKLFALSAQIASSKAGQKAIETTIERLLPGPRNG